LKSSQKYFLLAAVFGLAYAVVTYTEIYESSSWFRFFTVLAALAYAINGLNHFKKEKNKE
jgi:hypothetical protein|tara:strand:- start:841 stop:1020 length:180 start_codon:yes stop_codon:yes gene_type:complete